MLYVFLFAIFFVVIVINDLVRTVDAIRENPGNAKLKIRFAVEALFLALTAFYGFILADFALFEMRFS